MRRLILVILAVVVSALVAGAIYVGDPSVPQPEPPAATPPAEPPAITPVAEPPAPVQTQTGSPAATPPAEPPAYTTGSAASADNQTDFQPIPQSISDASNAFALEFYKQIHDSDENIFFSPTSMYTAFSILYEGARGNTASQIQDVFGFEPDDTTRHNHTAHMAASINRDDPHATLDLANALWIANWFEPYDSFLDIAHKTYLAGAETVNFTDAEDGVKRINQWASDNTNGKIDKVIAQKDVNNLTAMVINNAIYFKGTWLTQFLEEDTRESDFYRNGTEDIVTADFMNVHGMFDYADTDGVQILRMPYEGDRLSMLVVLPHDADGLKQTEETLSAGQIQEWMERLSSHEVIVSIPKFETKTNYHLNDYLKSMGMPDAFDKYNADLSGIADLNTLRGNLYVDKASHDAYVKVNEEGTEAAAVTTIIITTESLPPPPPRFIADHPFIFTIYDEESNMILFMGRISDPTDDGTS